jgi:hypothetical protein
MSYDELGELMGHISIGLELVNALWRRLSVENADAWKNLTPASEDVRMHLLHLIGAHHGEPQFGSPVSPKTPEAMALHYIDNLDARLEMFAAGYTTAKPLAARIFDRVRPLPANLVKSLEKFQEAAVRTGLGTNFCDTLRAHANRSRAGERRSSRSRHLKKRVSARRRNQVAAAIATQQFYLASSRNQRKAMEVCASLASCPPWNVPIFIR